MFRPLKINISLDYYFNLMGVTQCSRFSVDHFIADLGRKASSEETVNTSVDHGQKSNKQT